MKAFISFIEDETMNQVCAVSKIEANTMQEILEQIINKHGTGFEEVVGNGVHYFSIEDLLLNIGDNNGEDCDYIISIIVDGELVFNCAD